MAGQQTVPWSNQHRRITNLMYVLILHLLVYLSPRKSQVKKQGLGEIPQSTQNKQTK